MSNDIIIRRYRLVDLPTLLALFRDTVRRVNSRDYSPDQVAAWAPEGPHDPARWETLADRFTVVAEIDRQVVGFSDLEPNGHVDRFFVHADHQGWGIGRVLLSAIIAEAERADIPRLFAEVSITARPFFERHGFVVRAEQQVVIRGLALTNFQMERMTGHTPRGGGARPEGDTREIV